TAALVDSFVYALLVDRQPYGFHEGAYSARRIGMGEKDAVDDGRQHLLEHPGVGSNRRLIGAVDRGVGRGRPAYDGRSGWGPPPLSPAYTPTGPSRRTARAPCRS